MQNHITVWYAEDGKCILEYKHNELIASIDIEDKPQLNMTHWSFIPFIEMKELCEARAKLETSSKFSDLPR